jgi:hypothetical protein
MKDKNDIVIIHLDRPRELRFGHKALKTLGALTGKDIDALTAGNDLDLEDLEKFMYCGLLSDAKANNETLNLEDMEDLLDTISFGELVQKMQEAMQKSFGGISDPNSGNPATKTPQKKQKGHSAGKKA